MSGELQGRTVLLTRRREQQAGLVRALEAHGARVVELPALAVAPPSDPAPLEQALRKLESFDWVAFTSANAVEAVREGLARLGLPTSVSARGPRIAVVGEATAAAVREAFPGEEPALRPASGTGGAALAEALAVQGVRGSRVLLPVSSRGRPELEQGLVAAGARVERVVAYSSQAPQGFARAWAEAMDLGAELVVFASPSAVAAVAEASGPKPRLPAVVIGPTTEAAARAAGFRIRAAANEASEEGLLGAVVRALAGLA